MAANDNLHQGQFSFKGTSTRGPVKYRDSGWQAPSAATPLAGNVPIEEGMGHGAFSWWQHDMSTSGRISTQTGVSQLPMFMTPREIVSKYQVLEGDRDEHNRSGYDWGDTARRRNTAGDLNYQNHGVVNSAGQQMYRRAPSSETDEQVLARKLEESQYPVEHYAEARGAMRPEFDAEEALMRTSAPKSPGWSANSSRWDSWNAAQDEYLGRKEDEFNRTVDDRNIWESVRDEGVHQPITLATDSKGTMGKQEILGGHHRLASALDVRPDDLVPVVHSPSLDQAKSDKYQRYT